VSPAHRARDGDALAAAQHGRRADVEGRGDGERSGEERLACVRRGAAQLAERSGERELEIAGESARLVDGERDDDRRAVAGRAMKREGGVAGGAVEREARARARAGRHPDRRHAAAHLEQLSADERPRAHEHLADGVERERELADRLVRREDVRGDGAQRSRATLRVTHEERDENGETSRGDGARDLDAHVLSGGRDRRNGAHSRRGVRIERDTTRDGRSARIVADPRRELSRRLTAACIATLARDRPERRELERRDAVGVRVARECAARGRRTEPRATEHDGTPAGAALPSMPTTRT